MKSEQVTVVRVYLTEGEKQIHTLLKRLHDWEKVRGVTVFRGISGYGESGVLRSAGLLDLSLNLPVVVEFFDTPDKVQSIIEHLSGTVKPGHLIWWTANINTAEQQEG